MTKLSFHANGKLLLSGEYFVLDGAEAIGLPCYFGQSLTVVSKDSGNALLWKSITNEEEVWFEGLFNTKDLSIEKTSDENTSIILQNILLQAQSLNPSFLKTKESLTVKTHLEFPRLWGLGSSSTLIFNIAKWAKVDPFLLSNKTLGGSGYDIACAGADAPIIYQIKDNLNTFKKVAFDPNFKDNLFFVYLGKKQNSREGIKHYRAKAKKNDARLERISYLSQQLINVQSLLDFQKIILEHEQLVSETIEQKRAQDIFFPDFEGVIKSLGAWGGDFVLAATKLEKEKAQDYFNKKGYEVFLTYNQMVK